MHRRIGTQVAPGRTKQGGAKTPHFKTRRCFAAFTLTRLGGWNQSGAEAPHSPVTQLA